MVFEKASTRTRVSFEAGMYQMGGSVIHLTTGDSQLGRAEPIEDTARVISRMVDIVMIRTFEQGKIERFAAALARARHQRPDQRIPPLPDPGRHLHLRRAPRFDPRAQGRVDRRRQQHGLHLAAGRAARSASRCTSQRRRATASIPALAPAGEHFRVYDDPAEAATTSTW
jgi:hypothetical protein